MPRPANGRSFTSQWWQTLLDLRFPDTSFDPPRVHTRNNIRVDIPNTNLWLVAFRKRTDIGVMVSGKNRLIDHESVRVAISERPDVVSRLPGIVRSDYVSSHNQIRFASVRQYRDFPTDDAQRAWLASTLKAYLSEVAPIFLRNEDVESERQSLNGTRVVRDTIIANRLKFLHNFACQICARRLETPQGPYAEGHHIQPLGTPHDGPDVQENILILCPNCHLMCDRFAYPLSLAILRNLPEHEILERFIEYHNRCHCALIAEPPPPTGVNPSNRSRR